jgi:hypothetical protein
VSVASTRSSRKNRHAGAAHDAAIVVRSSACCAAIRIAALIAVRFGCVLLVVAGIFSVLRIALGG